MGSTATAIIQEPIAKLAIRGVSRELQANGGPYRRLTMAISRRGTRGVVGGVGGPATTVRLSNSDKAAERGGPAISVRYGVHCSGTSPAIRPKGVGEIMTPLLWILVAVLVIAAIAGGITISPFLLILIAVAILIYFLVVRGSRTTY